VATAEVLILEVYGHAGFLCNDITTFRVYIDKITLEVGTGQGGGDITLHLLI
jgi:hypothetical protein